ncbi:response regulator [Rhodoferax sp. GW822-FHT02A01]|uniref:response regulator transcription factor n=1 Tax=Rhodoferax sp. GW822-FHT02A01 TaxID=3141537 RepID=UPI00315CBD16
MQSFTAVSIESCPSTRWFIRMALEFSGFSVAEACEGPAGLELVYSLCPDLVLVGCGITGIQAIELCKLIRLDFQLNKTVVVMLSDRGDDLEVQEGLKAGASAYLVKPFSPVRLISLAHQLVHSPFSVTSSNPS